MCEHSTETTLVFLPADGEAPCLLLPCVASLQHSATRKHLFLYPQGARSGLRKPKKDKHQH